MNPFRRPSDLDEPAPLDEAAPVEIHRHECLWIGFALMAAGIGGLILMVIL